MTTPDIYFPNLGISFNNVSRVAFTIFGFSVYKYGAIIAIGVIFAIALAVYEAKRTNQNPDDYTDFAFWGILCGIIGARLYYLIFHSDSLTEFFAIRNGGLAIYGGILGALIALAIYTHIKHIEMLKFTDTVAMSLLVGQIIGRWGNFFNREAFGGATESLLAMAYKAEQVSGLKIVSDTTALYNGATYPLHSLNGVNYIWVHPTFFYEGCWNFCLLLLIFFTRKHKKFEGQLSAMYFAFYGIGRFIIESMRTDQLKIGSLPVSMLVSAVMLGVAVAITAVQLKKR